MGVRVTTARIVSHEGGRAEGVINQVRAQEKLKEQVLQKMIIKG